MPNGNPEARPAPALTLPRQDSAPREAFLVLPGLNLHPHRLDPLTDVLNTAGAAAIAPRLTGFATPGDPALRRVRAADWLADVDAAWQSVHARLPDAAPSLLGYSLGGLLGLLWSLEAGVPLRRAILLAPALQLRPLLRAVMAVAGVLLPGRLWLPSRAPATYRFHSGTTVAAYRALAVLEHRLGAHLDAWLGGEGGGPPPMLIAASADDELISLMPLGALAQAFPERVTLLPLNHTPRPGFPAHLGLDATTLGETEWQRLLGTLRDWLRRTDADATAAAAGTATVDGGASA
ncbi:MAG TPA: alpha/beta hydrolase [bacterium]|nr:alpha/beta hydrolase [bacterium]